jgi:hypothetical protein
MTHQLRAKIVACLLVIVFPAMMMSAETHAAMLYAAGAISLNGVGAERSSAVFAGDKIQTPANGLVTLTSEGSTVLLGPSSLLVYQGTMVELGAGTAMVTTDRAMKTQVQKLMIAPAAPGRSSYRVARADGRLLIAALHGPLKISDGAGEDKLVAEGETATLADPADPQGGPTPGASTGVSINKKAAIIVGVAAAAAAALIVIETTKSPVSEK